MSVGTTAARVSAASHSTPSHTAQSGIRCLKPLCSEMLSQVGGRAVEPPWYDSLALQALHFADDSLSSSKYNRIMLLFSDFWRSCLPLLELGWDILLRSFKFQRIRMCCSKLSRDRTTEWVVRILGYSDYSSLITECKLLGQYRDCMRLTPADWLQQLEDGSQRDSLAFTSPTPFSPLSDIIAYPLYPGVRGQPTPVMTWTELLYLYW